MPDIYSQVFNDDCIKIMKQYPNKYFDLAVVDPPYGIGFSDYERGSSGIKVKERYTKNGKKDWDKGIPTDEYFEQLFRVSKNQIIWGGNYFDLPPTQCFIFWYKQNPVPNFADGELAWTSFKKPAVCIDYNNYAKPGQIILDTHLGSGSSRIAADRAGLNFIGCEIDTEYYTAAEKRFKDYKAQLTLF